MLHVFIRDDQTVVATHDVSQMVALETYTAQGATRVLRLPADAVQLNGAAMTLTPDWTDHLGEAIKGECSRRINVVLKDLVTQTNMVAASVALSRKEAADTLTVDEVAELELLQAGQAWVRAMQAVARTLILGEESAFGDDSHWPAPPAGLAALAGEY